MKNRKIKIGHSITAILPEASILFSQVLFILSCYFIFYKDDRYFFTVALLVIGTFAMLNIMVMFNSLRPWRISRDVFYGERSNNWASLGYGLVGFILMIVSVYLLLFALVNSTSYAAAQLIIACGTGWALLNALVTVFGRNFEGLKLELFKKFKRWHLSLILYGIIGTTAWFIADWNPTLIHYSTKLKVTKVKNLDFIQPGDICEADIGIYPEYMKIKKCRVRFFCGGKRLFGRLGEGMIKCSFNYRSKDIVLFGEDPLVNDGDPAFRINTKKRLVQYSESYSLYKGAELESEITDIRPFSLYRYLPLKD